MNYTENAFMMESESSEGFYRTSLKKLLKENYSDVNNYLNGIIPSKEMYFKKEEIDNILSDLSKGVAYTLKELPNGISSYISSSDPSIYYSIISERITYGLIFIVSKKILSSLIHIIDPSYIFHYIKDSIVMPNIKNIVNILLDLNEKDEANKRIELDTNLCSDIRSFITAFVINLNYEAAAKLLDNKLEEITNNRDLVELELKRSKYVVPDVVYDLLLPTSNTNEYLDNISVKVKAFHDQMKKAHTDKRLTYILKNSCVLNEINEGQISNTIKEIRNIRGYSDTNVYIDDVTSEELDIIRRILNGSPILREEEYFKDRPYILKNFKYIKQFYNPNTDDLVFDEQIVYIKRETKVIHTFEYLNPNMIQENESVFNLFKSSGSKMKEIFMKNPASSVLSQSVIVPGLLTARNRQMQVEPMDLNEKIQHRAKMIAILKNKFRSNYPILENCTAIEKGPLLEIKYIKDYFKSTNYKIKNEKKALYTLVELDRVYKMAFEERQQRLKTENKNN